MNFKVAFASDDHKPFEVEVSTIDELLELSKKYNNDIILSFKGIGKYPNSKNEITIYDSWVD